MEEAYRLFLEACSNFHKPEALQYLSVFPSLPNSMQICQEVLNSSVPVDTKFQAAIAFRESSLLCWNSMSKSDQATLLEILYKYIVHFSQQPGSHMVAATFRATLAQALKLFWLDSHNKENREAIQRFNTIFKNNKDAITQKISIEIIEAVVTEFNTTTARPRPLGLTWEYHEHCRRSLQDNFLGQLFVQCIECAHNTVASKYVFSSADDGICLSAINALCAILNWDFRMNNRIMLPNERERPVSDLVYVIPSKDICQVLFHPVSFGWLKDLHSFFESNFNIDNECQPLESSSWNLINLLCSISPTIFPKNEKEESVKTGYLGKLLGIMLSRLGSIGEIVKGDISEQEEYISSFCRAINALTSSFTASEILAANKEALNLFSKLIVDLVKGRDFEIGTDMSWKGICTDFLIEAWARLCQPKTDVVYKSIELITFSDEVKKHSEIIYKQLVDKILSQALNNSLNVESVSSKFNEKIAEIGRPSANYSMDLLCRMIDVNIQKLTMPSFPCDAKKNAVLCLQALVLLVGYMIADDSEGECISIPPAISNAIDECKENGMPNLAVKLSFSLLRIGGLATRPETKNFITSDLICEFVKMASRWADTYLMRSELVVSDLQKAFGPSEQGIGILEEFCALVNLMLSSSHNDKNLRDIVCDTLLPSLTHTKTARKNIMKCKSWKRLFLEFTSSREYLETLSQKQQRKISSALMSTMDTVPKVEIDIYVDQMMAPIVENVEGLTALLKDEVGRSGIVNDESKTYLICSLLERLRGYNRAIKQILSVPKRVYKLFDKLLANFLIILNIYTNNEDVIYLIIRLAAELVEVHILFLTVEELNKICLWVLEILKIYSASRAKQVSRLENEVREYKDLRALLVLLRNIVDKDLVDVKESQGGGAQIDMAQVTLMGLQIVIPLITPENLKYPKLCAEYYEMLLHMCEIYPKHVLSLPLNSLYSLLETLHFGLLHSNRAIVRSVLESLTGLMEYHCMEQKKETCNKNSNLPSNAFVPHFFKTLLEVLLLNKVPQQVIVSSAPALILMLSCQKSSLAQIAHEITPKDWSEDRQNALKEKIINKLGSYECDPFLGQDRQKFSDFLVSFVIETQGIVTKL